MYEAIIIGGGPAGLQAALTLGRMHRRTLLLDSREYRNATVDHAHNLLATTASHPRICARGAARARRVRDARDPGCHGLRVAADAEGVRVEVDGETLHAGHLVLATASPTISRPSPDSRALGRPVANCPFFCHGHEFAGRPVAVLTPRRTR